MVYIITSIILMGISIGLFFQANKITNKLVYLTKYMPNALSKEESNKRVFQLQKIYKLVEYIYNSNDEVIIFNAKKALRLEISSYVVFILAILITFFAVYRT